jgi:hypothetical protein
MAAAAGLANPITGRCVAAADGTETIESPLMPPTGSARIYLLSCKLCARLECQPRRVAPTRGSTNGYHYVGPAVLASVPGPDQT